MEGAAAKGGSALRVVVAGAGIAGVSAAEAVREVLPDASLTLLSREKNRPYYRMNLTRFLAGEVEEDRNFIHPADWYEDRRIDLQLGVSAAAIDPAAHEVRLDVGRKLQFDRLVLACGAQSFMPPVPGMGLKGVWGLRTLEDAKGILAAAEKGGRWICVGGGILGVETAGALARRGAKVTLLENSEWLMSRQLNRRGGELLAGCAARMGIQVMTMARTKDLTGGKKVTEVTLENGERLPADGVVISAGVRSETLMARETGLKVNLGVMVGDSMETSVPGIYAAGDMAEHRGVLYGTWGPAQIQGRVAGLNAAGQKTGLGAMARSNTLKVLGLPVFSIGRTAIKDDRDVLAEEGAGERYACLLFREQRLEGGILMGDIAAASRLKNAIESAEDLGWLLSRGLPAWRLVESLRE